MGAAHCILYRLFSRDADVLDVERRRNARCTLTFAGRFSSNRRRCERERIVVMLHYRGFRDCSWRCRRTSEARLLADGDDLPCGALKVAITFRYASTPASQPRPSADPLISVGAQHLRHPAVTTVETWHQARQRLRTTVRQRSRLTVQSCRENTAMRSL